MLAVPVGADAKFSYTVAAGHSGFGKRSSEGVLDRSRVWRRQWSPNLETGMESIWNYDT